MGWNDVTTHGNSENKEGKVKFVDTSSGVVQLRALDDAPYSRYTHWIPQANGGKGTTVDCIGRGCPVCADIAAKKKAGTQQKYTSRKLHAMNFLNRDTGNVEILDKGKRCYEALGGIREMIGDLRGFDVKIKIAGTGTDTTYTPIPMPAKVLTDSEKALEKYDFDKVYPKLTAEQISMLMDGKDWKDIFGDETTNNDQPILDDVDFVN